MLFRSRDQLCRKFGRDKHAAGCLKGLTVLDIGCGGGLVAEPLARLGAEVTGIDPAAENIEAAKTHAEGARLDIIYRTETAEDLAASGAAFDCVLLLEVVEHVPDMPAFLKAVAPLVKGLHDHEPLVRMHAAWGLGRIGTEAARSALQERRIVEEDAEVRAEIAAAL